MQETNPRRSQILLGICALVTGLIWGAYKWDPANRFSGLESSSEQFRQRIGNWTPMNTNLVFLGIDKTSYADDILESEAAQDPMLATLRGNYPWTREVWAVLIDKLVNAGARMVILDIIFAAEGEGDAKFAAVLNQYSNKVVIGWTAMDNAGEFLMLMPSPTVIDPGESGMSNLDPRVGFAAIWPDLDSVVKRAYYQVSMAEIYGMQWGSNVDIGRDIIFPSLSARAMHSMGYESKVPPNGSFPMFRYTGTPGRFHPYSLKDMFFPHIWKATYEDKGFFKDKIVLVGPVANIFQDKHTTPVGIMLGPEIHLHQLNAALHQNFLKETLTYQDNLLIFGAGAVAVLLCVLIRNLLMRFFCGLLVSAVFCGIALLSYNHYGLFVLAIPPLAVVNMSVIASWYYEYRVEKKRREKLRATMDVYFSPKISAYVLANPGSMEARSAQVTLLLTDLRNSTPLAEQLGPGGMFSLLNQVFEVETNAVMAEDGALEHFLGDQFLTYWGAPQPQPDGPNQALRAARQLIIGMEEVKSRQAESVRKLFGYGVALHSGSVLFGNKGSAKRLDFGLVGDTVNEAARIEALTKYYGVQLLVSKEIFDQLKEPGRHRLVDRTIVKGKSEPVVLYELESPRTKDDFDQAVTGFNTAFALYTEGKFAEAKPLFEKLVNEHQDGPSKQMILRCEHLLAEPPADWHGVWRMESK